MRLGGFFQPFLTREFAGSSFDPALFIEAIANLTQRVWFRVAPERPTGAGCGGLHIQTNSFDRGGDHGLER